MGAILSVTDLRTHFFTPRGVVRAVDGVSLELGEGEAIGVVGESGSGKSMTALSIVAMQRVRATEVAMIFQDPGSYLNPVMSIGDQIAEAIGRRRSRDRATLDKVIGSLRDVQIPEPA